MNRFNPNKIHKTNHKNNKYYSQKKKTKIIIIKLIKIFQIRQ